MNNKHALTIVFFLSTLYAHSQTSPWEPMNKGLLHLLVYTLDIDQSNPEVMYAGTEYGNLYKSIDGGFNWQLSRNGIPPNYNNELVSALFIDRKYSNIVYAGFGGRVSTKNLFKSTDGASTWQVIDTPTDWKEGGILNIYRTYGFDSKLYCGLGWKRGVHSSTDEKVWAQILTGLGVQAIAGPLNNSRIIFAGFSSMPGLKKSDDGGKTWKNALTKSSSFAVRAITVSTRDENKIYIGVTGADCGLHKSTDGGTTWTRCSATGEISEIAVHPQNDDLIYYSAIGTGIMRSTDGGKNWTTLMEGMPTTDVMRVKIAPTYPVSVYAVTLKHGIFRLVDEEIRREVVPR